MNLTRSITEFLAEDPATRDSDNLLYIKVLEKYGNEVGFKDILSKPIGAIYKSIGALKIPTIESVGRIRRLIQAQHPEYSPNAEVEDWRAEKEKEWRKFSKQKV